MCTRQIESGSPVQHCCCPDGRAQSTTAHESSHSATSVLAGGLGMLGSALTGILSAATSSHELLMPPSRNALVVKPVFSYPQPKRSPLTSWRNWGGIETPEDVRDEVARIEGELEQLKAKSDFPLSFLPLATIRRPDELAAHNDDIRQADVLLFYAGGDGGGDLMANVNHIDALGKRVLFFVRHKSGPLYYWYEGAMARFLHQHTDELATKSVGYEDVVVDSMDEVLWRLRAHCGLRNTVGSRIVAVGGPGGWAQPAGMIPELASKRCQLDIQTLPYDELSKLIETARSDAGAVELARQRADAYLAQADVALETKRSYVDNAFLLDQIFRRVMAEADCRALTINGCMGTIMPMAQTTACLTLSTLNDDGYLAFCESDFVVIPAGILLANITGKPVFLNDPTYPHHGLITLAHCTAPRKLSGATQDAVRIMTHFESDYGAAPKVEMPVGQVVTNIIPDFRAQRWVGLRATIEAAPLLPICRSQIDVRYDCSDKVLAEQMPGFHWMTAYGDHLREVGYAARKLGLTWQQLS